MKLMVLPILVLAFASVEARASTIQYQVPVTSSDLVPYATFTISDYSAETHPDGTVTVAYTLPAELVGQPQKVTFEGANYDQATLSGPNGTMICDGDRCQVQYKGLQFDSAAVEKTLTAESTSPNELQQREKVAALFHGDPGGVIIYRQLGP